MMRMLVQPSAKPAEAQPQEKPPSNNEEGESHPFAAILRTAHSSMGSSGPKKDNKGDSPPQTSADPQPAPPAQAAHPVHTPQFLEPPSFALVADMPGVPVAARNGQPAAVAGSDEPTQASAGVDPAALAEALPGTEVADSLASADAVAGAGAVAGAVARRSAAEVRADGRTPDPQTALAPAKAPASPSALREPTNPLLSQKDSAAEPKHQTAVAPASPSPATSSKIVAPSSYASKTTASDAATDASRSPRTTGARSPNTQNDTGDSDASPTATSPRPVGLDASQVSVPVPGGDAKDVTVVNGSSTPAAVATPDAAAPHVAAASVANQAVLRRVATGEIQDPELGRVAVRAAGSNASIDVAVSVDRADTHFALHSSSGAMAADLRQADVPLGHLRFERSQSTLADTTGNGHGAFAQDTPRDSHSSPEAEEADDTTPTLTAGRVRIVL